MEGQIKYFSNNLVDRLVSESKVSTNSLSIQIPFSYAIKLVPISWNDVLFAIHNNYFDKNCAIEYACFLLEDKVVDENIIELATLNILEITKEELLKEYVEKFAHKETEKEKKESKDKIMYILLNLLYENKGIFEDPLKVVEIVYDDFGFPKAIERFIRYMPVEDNQSIGTEEQMYKRWQDYLCSQKIRFEKT